MNKPSQREPITANTQLHDGKMYFLSEILTVSYAFKQYRLDIGRTPYILR